VVLVACCLRVDGLSADDDPPTAAKEKARLTSAAEETFFENKVRPLLVAKCVTCHGPKKQHADLRLDSLPGMLKGGESGAAIVPFKPDESLLIEAVRRESFEMPPNETLTADQVGVLTRWIQQGAQWPDSHGEVAKPTAKDFKNHWAFRPIKRPSIPSVRNTSWPRNEIDYFILNKLERRDMTPSPPSSLPTLARRIKWDLVGLPVS